MFAMFLPTLLIFSATWRLSEATTCTAVTENTCEKTNYMSGTCSNGLCACVDGFEPTRFGCIKKVKPVVTVNATDGFTKETITKGSGEVRTGGPIILNCNTTRNYTYVWTKDGVVLTTQTGQTIRLAKADPAQAGQYRCQVRLDASDYASEFSDPVTIKVVAETAPFTSQPIVVPMSQKAMPNSVIVFECTNIPSGLGISIWWLFDGTNITLSTVTYSVNITAQTLGKKVACVVGPQLTTPESLPVFVPSSFTDNISGATIVEAKGESTIWKEVNWKLTLTCIISDTDIALSVGVGVYVRWTKDGTDIAKTQVYSKDVVATTDAGVYRCYVTVGNLAPKESAPLSVVVFQTGEIVGKISAKIVPSGATPLVGGYMSITCIVDARNLSRLKYLWGKDTPIIDELEDREIQINGVTAKDGGTYTCYISTEDTPGKLLIPINTPVTVDTVVPKAPTSNKPDQESFGVGNSYTLTCAGYDSPGVTYRWMEGTQVIAGATSMTYTLQAKPGTNVYTCQIVFNKVNSLSSPGLTVAAKNIISVVVVLAGTTVSSTTIKPLNSGKVSLECEATTAASSSGTLSYAWLKSDQKLQDQTAATYDFTAGAASDGEIKCAATIGSETATSNSVIVTSVANLEAPIVEVYNYSMLSGQQVYPAGGSYMLICRTASHTDSVYYTWMKDESILIQLPRRYYTISDAKQGNDGDSGAYTCRAIQGINTSSSSKAVTITISDPGLPCKFLTDCQGTQFLPSCVNNRCECANGYKPKGNNCTNGVSHLGASVILLMIAALAARWLYQEELL